MEEIDAGFRSELMGYDCVSCPANGQYLFAVFTCYAGPLAYILFMN